jgi:hypothetical protein
MAMGIETLFGAGLFGGTAPRGADVNVLAQLGLGGLLLAGVLLARRGFYRAHGACQSLALVVAVGLAAAWMIPALRTIFLPGLPVRDRASVVVIVHGLLGGSVLLLGAYVVLVAGTRLVPPRFRFQRYRPWMRTLLVLWWVTIGLGLSTYWVAWMAPR